MIDVQRRMFLTGALVAIFFPWCFNDVLLSLHHDASPAAFFFVASFPTATLSPSTESNSYRKNPGPIRSKTVVDELVSTGAQIIISASPTLIFLPTPIIDQEGRQWRSSATLASQNLVRDGLADLELKANNTSPFVATVRQHSLLLRGTEKKGKFVNDDERWTYRYDALCKFHKSYGHTCVPFNWGIVVDEKEASGDESTSRTRKGNAMNDDDVVEEDILSFYSEDDDDPILQNAGGLSHDNIDDDDDESSSDESKSSNNIQPSSEEFTEPYLRLELGYWVAQQRHYYKQRLRQGDSGVGKRLTLERIEHLNKLNFIWDVKEARWETQYLQFQDFVMRHGHACVTQSSTLGRWCYRQRYHKRIMENRVTVDWESIPENAYMPAEENPDLSIFAEECVTETAAGGKEYKGRPVSTLTPERRAKLDELCFIWDVREQAWEEHFHSLCEYQQKHKTTKVHLAYGKLGVWVKKQREAWKHQQIHGGESVSAHTYSLTPERIAKLDSINFSWQGHDYTWEEHYHHLLEYKKEYNHVNVAQKLDIPVQYPKLGSWLTDQRSEGRKFEQNDGKGSRLTKERYALLRRAGVEWDPLLAQFQSRVEQLRQYQSEYGTLQVKSKHDKSLYSWVRKMAKDYEQYLDMIEKEEIGEGTKRSPLEDDTRRQMLDELAFKEELLSAKR